MKKIFWLMFLIFIMFISHSSSENIVCEETLNAFDDLNKLLKNIDLPDIEEYEIETELTIEQQFNLAMNQEFVLFAMDWVGFNYVWNGKNPITDRGFDCSGFVRYCIFNVMEISWVLHIPRSHDTAHTLYYRNYIEPGNKEFGSLNFYRLPNGRIDHVTIYLFDDLEINPMGGPNNLIQNPGQIRIWRNDEKETREIINMRINWYELFLLYEDYYDRDYLLNESNLYQWQLIIFEEIFDNSEVEYEQREFCRFCKNKIEVCWLCGSSEETITFETIQ